MTAAADGFAASGDRFGAVVSWLDGEEAGRLTHGELEAQLGTAGRDLIRQLLQDHLDLRAAREERRTGVTGAGQVTRSRAESGHQRPLATVFGQVRVTRMAYRAPGAANLYPADAALNLPAGKYSHGLRRLAAAQAARG
ncbi:MAG TPA: ISKra4 family transposase, partial [Streptosporangiaceae bacterium]